MDSTGWTMCGSLIQSATSLIRRKEIIPISVSFVPLVLALGLGALGSVPAPTDSAPRKEPPIPLLVLRTTCSCPPTVVGTYLLGGAKNCGTPAQPCFIITNEPNTDDDPVPGTCVVGGEPAPCPGPATQCSFPGYKVVIHLSACADAASCGGGPYQAVGVGGKKVGQPVSQGDEREISVSIGNLSCRNIGDYVVGLRNSQGQPAVTYNLRAMCDKCSADLTPYVPPAPQ
jgi:hypothetical protein